MKKTCLVSSNITIICWRKKIHMSEWKSHLFILCQRTENLSWYYTFVAYIHSLENFTWPNTMFSIIHLASFKSESLLFIGDICLMVTPLLPRVWSYLLYYFCCNRLKFCFLRNPVSQYLNWLYLIILKYPSVVTCLLRLWLFSLKLHI